MKWSKNEVDINLRNAATQGKTLEELVEGESSNKRFDGTWALRNAQREPDDHRMRYNPHFQNLANNTENHYLAYTLRIFKLKNIYQEFKIAHLS